VSPFTSWGHRGVLTQAVQVQSYGNRGSPVGSHKSFILITIDRQEVVLAECLLIKHSYASTGEPRDRAGEGEECSARKRI